MSFGCDSIYELSDIPIAEVDELTDPDDELLELTQKTTFNYFWDFADSSSGMAKERSQSTVITIGGSGFGISCFPVAVERGWITKDEAIERMQKVLTFLEGSAKYHGAFAHWYTSSGVTVPFGTQDDGGDIVETALLFQGLLINRQYFSGDNTEENDIRDRITTLWEAVEWDWYTQGKKSITWHWSSTHGFALNHTVSGWNEALIVYVLAAASPTHSIDKETYEKGWARSGAMKNGETYYDRVLPLGETLGGPLFFAHYSFIGLDPTNLSDQYATNYFVQNRAHSLINYEYCKDNPKNYAGYSENSWGLTASDNNNGYSAHSPTNDLGVITPTAALSSFPYTPEESRQALEYFYERKNELWGEYGFYDAFSDEYGWVADGYLAIDQGPIVAMIENYRTQLLWNLFMQDQNVKDGLTKLGFTY
ncbi:glucoamylase family protein [Algibacter agarivorans]|uniref:Glucoamylase family protein n=2 Tax=Algibacter agarivorans TaxID=1109741 RepID=A0ABP9GVI1_9FLAO